MLRLPALLTALLGFTAAMAGQEPARPPAADGITRLIEKLGDENFRVREEAFEKLKSLGVEALPHLRRHAGVTDPEVRSRVQSLIDLIENPDGKETGDEGEKPRRMRPDRDRVGGPPGVEDRGGEPRRQRMPRPGDFENLADFQQALMAWAREQARGLFERGRSGGFPFPDFDRSFSFDFDVPGGARGLSETRVMRDGEELEFRREADGRVRLKVMAGEGADRRTETFEASTFAEWKEKYAEVYAKYKDSGVFDTQEGRSSLRIGPHRFEWRFPDPLDLDRWFRDPEPGEDRPPVAPDSPIRPPARAGEGPRLGVEVTTVPPALRTQLGLPDGKGLLVLSVEAGSPAAAAGLLTHDIILAFDGLSMTRSLDLRDAFRAVEKGGDFEITVLRASKELKLGGKRP